MELAASTREILGKKVKKLRRQGITPVNLFGHKIEPLALQCDTSQLQRVLAQSGRTGLINLKLDRAKKARNVMVREVQRAPRSGVLLHVDFYQVRMDEKIRVEVPIVTIGEAPALKLKENFLAHELNELTIECLPDEIPSRIEIDVSTLAEADQAIYVEDISLDDGIAVINSPDQMVAKISTQFVEEVIEEEVEEVAEVEAEAEVEAAAEEQRGEDSSDS
jgi:large subunit ribosomal protein L25